MQYKKETMRQSKIMCVLVRTASYKPSIVTILRQQINVHCIVEWKFICVGKYNNSGIWAYDLNTKFSHTSNFRSILQPSPGDWQPRLGVSDLFWHMTPKSGQTLWATCIGSRGFWARCQRGHLHPSQQAITQQGRGPIQVTLSVWPDFGVTCQKDHWLLIWVSS